MGMLPVITPDPVMGPHTVVTPDDVLFTPLTVRVIYALSALTWVN